MDPADQPSIINAMQELVQQDLRDSTWDEASPDPRIDDPLNAMEPRPVRNVSEDSLCYCNGLSRSYVDLQTSILDLHRRLEILEHRVIKIMQLFSFRYWFHQACRLCKTSYLVAN